VLDKIEMTATEEVISILISGVGPKVRVVNCNARILSHQMRFGSNLAVGKR